MKLCALLLIVCACSKPDDVPALRDEAHTTVAYYADQLDKLDDRFRALKKRGEDLKVYYPGSDEAGMLATATFNGLQALRKELGEAGIRLQGANTPRELRARIDEYRDVAEDGIKPTKDRVGAPSLVAIGSALGAIESWVTHTEAVKAAGSAMIPP